jgi:HSP20 family protein
MPTTDAEFFSRLAEHEWFSETEGQLSVDVVETPEEIIVRSAIAGVSAENLDISVTADTVTIRGTRSHGCDESDDRAVHVRECYWGAFSRSVVLPCHIRPEESDATLKNGILTITMKKVEMRTNVSVINLDA